MHVSRQQTLCIALEALKSPHNALTIRLVDGATCTAREDADLGGVGWHWDLANDIRPEVAFFEDCLKSDRKLNLVLLRVLLDHRYDLERQVDVFTNAICHNIEDAIGWDKSDGSISIKSTQSHALVKLNVVDLDALVCRLGFSCSSRVGSSCSYSSLHQ